jgi:hypothetical protein
MKHKKEVLQEATDRFATHENENNQMAQNLERIEEHGLITINGNYIHWQSLHGYPIVSIDISQIEESTLFDIIF